jgi:WhiB family redox-sensing transcriptional regulator
MTADGPATGWRAEAACRGLPTSLFYPPLGTQVPEALLVCACCPVRVACDEHARRSGEEHGIWGGRTEADRARLDRRDATTSRASRRRPGPRPDLSDDDLVELVWSLDPDEPAAAQVVARLGVSVSTAYKYLHRGIRLGVIERRDRHLYPAT